MRVYLYIVITVFLAVFLKQWEPGLGNSSAGYGSLARNFAQDWQWFHLKLSQDFFNPYVDHPPLAIWLMGLILKVFGSSAHTVRLLSAFSALVVFTCLFLIVRRVFSERAAVWSVICLLLVNVFMNYTASGWLDMPMTGFIWAGAYFIIRGMYDKKLWPVALGSVFLGCSVLAKGVCALAVFPVFGFYAYGQFKVKKWYWPLIFGLFVLAPVAAFTYLYFKSQGYIFWTHYLHREVQVQTLDNGGQPFVSYFWHIKDTFRFGHLVTLLGIWGMVDLWRRGRKEWAVFLASGVLIHNLGYSWSTRHYSQYTVPVFPFLAIGAGYILDRKIKKGQAERMAQGMMIILMVVFVLVDLLPIRVKSGNENPFRSFQSTLRIMNDNKTVYFVGTMENQETWEDPASYIVWYWGREPRIGTLENLFKKIHHDDPKALGVVDSRVFEMREDLRAIYPLAQRCMYNDKLTVVAQPTVCDDLVKTWRYREPPKAFWERAP